MVRKWSCAEGAKNFAILFENILELRTSQQSLIKGAWDFFQPVAVPTVLSLKLEIQFQHSKGPDSDRSPPVE